MFGLLSVDKVQQENQEKDSLNRAIKAMKGHYQIIQKKPLDLSMGMNFL